MLCLRERREQVRSWRFGVPADLQNGGKRWQPVIAAAIPDALLGPLVSHEGRQLAPIDLLKGRMPAPGFLRLNIEPRLQRAGLSSARPYAPCPVSRQPLADFIIDLQGKRIANV